MTRTSPSTLMLLGAVCVCVCSMLCVGVAQAANPIPIIIDTDIGDEFDDSWAIGLALSSPAVEVKMIVTASNDTEARAKIVAKYLTAYNRTDIPIGVGVKQDDTIGPLYAWAKDFDMSSYEGKVYADGVKAVSQLIHESPEPLTMVAIAPFVNLASLIERFPWAATSIDLINAMGGAIHQCYNHVPIPPSCAEYNIAESVNSTQAMFKAPWPIRLTPLDSSGFPLLASDFDALAKANTTDHVVVKTLLETYCVWSQYKLCAPGSDKPFCCQTGSGDLFDPIATYMTIDRSGMTFDSLNLTVTSEGYTEVSSTAGRPVNVALKWTSADTFADFSSSFVQTLINGA